MTVAVQFSSPRESPPRRRLGALIAAIALGAAGCSASAASGDSGAYTLGLITSQTGTGSQLGVGELQGAQLAVDQINARGGVNGKQLKLRTADDQSNPAQAVLQTRKMLGGVDALVGPSLSGPCQAVIPLATSAQLIDYCLSPGVKPKPGSYQWSASAPTDTLADRLLAYWKGQGLTRVGLIYTTDASGLDGAHAVQQAAAHTGVSVVGQASYSPSAVSVTSQLQAATAGKPQALVVWSSGAAAGVAFKGIDQMGLKLPVATTDGNLTYAFLRRIADYTPDTLLIPATRDFWWQQQNPSTAVQQLERGYHDEFRARYGADPDFGPGVAYDGVLLVAQALEKAHGDATQARDALESLRGVSGVVGTYTFARNDHRGIDAEDVGIVRAVNGRLTFVGR
ncbi:ABC transporter substrate-binding protein [Amycolatopsis sp. NPDC051903]|uniref:ABC transporter substrate-binding protein n=1 Tax=Amycolatopsis sp. NPDC051903 TaxID=3363936 RepID=UPI0037A7F69E